jgi:hypothetical protein
MAWSEHLTTEEEMDEERTSHSNDITFTAFDLETELNPKLKIGWYIFLVLLAVSSQIQK